MIAESKTATICLENVTVTRKDRQGSIRSILNDISFTARSGEITAIVGPSGSGKSTLVRLINRLDNPSSGIIYLNGTDIAAMDPLQLRRQIAMVLQKPYMFEGTLLVNLQRPFLYRQIPPPAADSADILDIMERVHLPGDLIDRDAGTLSLGEQQRVNLARALIAKPQVILLDEPTGALDRPTADRLAEMLQEICRFRDLAVILVSHDLRLVQNTADRLIYMEAGRIMEEGSAADLLLNPHSPELRNFLAGPEKTGG